MKACRARFERVASDTAFTLWSSQYFASSFGGYWVGGDVTAGGGAGSEVTDSYVRLVEETSSFCIVAVPAGSYEVSVTAGDPHAASSSCLTVQGKRS